jgi:apolipoprotein D and lipocalin family protein
MRFLPVMFFLALSTGVQAKTWDFTVYLDEKPVGYHRFTLREAGAERELTSSARFEVRVLGWPVYRYAHDATEGWKGDCLTRLSSWTDDDGERFAVDKKFDGCEMSFAYWNPAILKRTQLFNPQTGRLEAVAVSPLGAGRYRIVGTKHPIELRYADNGEWIGLESPLANGRRLRYRLQGTVGQVDLPRFMGDWYVIANIPTFIEKGAHNAVESYRLDADGTVATTFTFRDGAFDGEGKRYAPRGFVLDATNVRWDMQFVWPFRSDYRIAYVDEGYTQTVIAREARDYVWIMARKPSMPEADLRRLVELAGAIGYDKSLIQKVPQRWN